MMIISRKEFPLVGSKIEVVLYDVDEVISELMFEDISMEGQRLQKIFNFFDQSSELSILNKKRKVKASKELLHLMKLCLKYCEETKGGYDISLGKQFLQRKQKKEVTEVKCSYKDISIDGNEITLNHPDVLIDLGSAAKGYIGDRIANFIKRSGIESGFIDLRGDMIAFGDVEEIIKVQHPREKDKLLFPFVMKDMAVATSGDYNQFDKTFDKPHIIGKKDIISATVAGDTLAESDIIATCMFVLGKERSTSFLQIHKDFKCLMIDNMGKEHFYNDFEGLLKS